jgi:hypothetical protein
MSYQLILLNNSSRHNFSKGLSSYVCLSKDYFTEITQQASSLLNSPQLIVMQANEDSLQEDLGLLDLLRSTELFKNAPVLVFTLSHTATETLLYFEHGATTCMLMPGAPQEWVNIINYIPAYWLEAA